MKSPTPEVAVLAARAMALDESIACGPAPYSCEDVRCPAHGREFEDETEDMRAARENYERRWRTEVVKSE
jgi:hypothetical protein